VAPSSVLSVYYDKICLKFASHDFLLYAVYICQKSLNFIYAFKCYQQIAINAGLSWPHFSWPTLYLQVPCTREKNDSLGSWLIACCKLAPTLAR